MTVYLWVRHLDGSILVRSPEVISLRNAAAREGPRNPQCGDLRPDDDGFVDSIRRSSRKSVPTVSPSTQAETSSGTARGKFQRETPERGETREQFRKKQDAAKNGVKNDKTPKVGKVRKRKRTPKQVAQAVLKEERTKKTKLPKSAAKLEERGRSGLTRVLRKSERKSGFIRQWNCLSKFVAQNQTVASVGEKHLQPQSQGKKSQGKKSQGAGSGL